MNIKAVDIELFKNLSQFELGNVFYDFHSDYDCINISFQRKALTLLLKKTDEEQFVSWKFVDVVITKLNFDYSSVFKSLTLDNLYRGRFEKNDQLYELSEDGMSYFYIEFYEGHSIEFFCNELLFESY